MRTTILADELVRRGHEVTWWGSNIEHRRKQPLVAGIYTIAPGYTVRLLPVPAYTRNISWRRYRGYKSLARSFLQEAPSLPPPDIVLTGLPAHDLTYAAVRFANQRGIPSLVDVQDLWPDSFLELLPRGLRSLGRVGLFEDFRRARFALTNASGIIGISNTYLEWGRSKAQRSARKEDGIFYLGSNPLRTRQSTSSESVFPDSPSSDRIVFGFLGVFGHTYDLQTILSAARLLANRGEHRAHFALAGTGDFAARLASQANGLPNVSFPGWLNAEEVESFLHRLDVGLATYAKGAPQSLPNKPFQYLAAGKPIISSLPGELREILETSEAGLNYTAGDPESLAAAVLEFINSPTQIASMGQNAYSLFRSKFNAETIYPQMVDHLEQVYAQNSATNKHPRRPQR